MPSLPPVRPNEGLRTAYQRKLERLIDEMDKSLRYWLAVAYRKTPPHALELGGGLATDASPAAILQRVVRRLVRRWLARFDELAPELAKYFATASAARSDASLRDALRKAGFTVKLRMSRAVNDVVQAAVAENVSLIRNIAQQHLASVEGIVMRSVQAGRDLGGMTDALEKAHGVTRRRAAFIARDQNNKATAMLTRARQRELGITKAKWLHSAGGNHPRHEHVKFSGQIYDVEKGHDFENGEGVVWPGTAINCRCVSIPVVPGFD